MLSKTNIYAHLTSLPPCAKLPKDAVKICKNENSVETSSGSSTAIPLSSTRDPINGNLLEFGDSVVAIMWSAATPFKSVLITLFSMNTEVGIVGKSVIGIVFVSLRILLGDLTPLRCRIQAKWLKYMLLIWKIVCVLTATDYSVGRRMLSDSCRWLPVHCRFAVHQCSWD